MSHDDPTPGSTAPDPEPSKSPEHTASASRGSIALVKKSGCPYCQENIDEGLLYGVDPDGLVLCRTCRAPLFYCDLGGSG